MFFKTTSRRYINLFSVLNLKQTTVRRWYIVFLIMYMYKNNLWHSGKQCQIAYFCKIFWRNLNLLKVWLKFLVSNIFALYSSTTETLIFIECLIVLFSVTRQLAHIFFLNNCLVLVSLCISSCEDHFIFQQQMVGSLKQLLQISYFFQSFCFTFANWKGSGLIKI